jgi:hypothetical protein
MPQWRLIEHLALAEEQVALAAKHVACQREIIAELERDGHNTTKACALLAEFEELQAMHVAERDRLLRELHDHKQS